MAVLKENDWAELWDFELVAEMVAYKVVLMVVLRVVHWECCLETE